MPSGTTAPGGFKIKISKIHAFAFAAVTGAFFYWTIFILATPLESKLLLLGAFAGLEILSFAYRTAKIDATVKEKKAGMDITIAEIKDCQKMLVNEEKTSAIMKFSSVVSHELKNPLSSLKNIAYYLIKTAKNEDPKGKRMMEMLSSEVDRADRMIGEFSNISHARRISKLIVNVSELIENALTECALSPAIEVKKEIEPGVEANIDPERIAVVFKNLIKNAGQASGEKGLIKVNLKRAGKYIEIVVTDSGAGIAAENLENIFEPMFTTRTKSLGLGLTVVRETVSAHDGRIEVSSEKGKGSTFKVFIPA